MSAAGGSQTRILIALVGGAALGCTVNWLVSESILEKSLVEFVVNNITKPIGELFIHLLFLPIIPLVFASLALGVTRLGGGGNVGRVGIKTIGYFIITTIFAAAIGLVMVNIIRPGERLPEEQRASLREKYQNAPGEKVAKPMGIDTIVNIIPKNPLEAFMQKEMLAVIFTAILVGVALTKIDQARAAQMIGFLEGVNQITDFIIRLAMKVAPIGVFALIFTTTALFGYQLLIALGAFVATVLFGLFLQMVLVFPPLVAILGGMSPITFFRRARGTMITAFSTSSSSATLPTAMKCAEDDLNVPPAISRFVLPLSASMNHNGTALFEGVTVMFLCQVFGRDMAIQDQLLALVLCVVTATGMAGVPGGSLPLIGLILVQFGVPAGAIGIVFGVDRILDMCRTCVNVTGDLSTAVYVANSESASIEPAPVISGAADAKSP